MDLHPVNLIVGSDSLVGSALMAELQQAGESVCGTTRRQDAVTGNNLYLDLSEDVSLWKCPSAVNAAVICAGVTRLRDCRRNPAASARVNVEGVCALTENLVSGGAFVIYLSTDQVFDGSVPCPSADKPLSPATEYGRQKAAAERRIRRWGDNVAIVRLSKILGPEFALFSGWKESLEKGEVIHPFSDMVMAPVPLSFVVSVLRFIIQQRISGIMQVSGGYDVSYSQTAYRAAQLLGAESTLVQPVKARCLEADREPLPEYSTLNVTRLKSILKMEPPDVWDTIEKVLLKKRNIQYGFVR